MAHTPISIWLCGQGIVGPKAVNKFAMQPQFGSVFVEGTLFGAVAKGCQKDSHFGAFPYDTYTYLRSLSINISTVKDQV